MLLRIFPILILILMSFKGEAQSFLLSGRVSDTLNHNPIYKAEVYCLENKNLILTNNQGKFSITVPDSNFSLRVSSKGYDTLILSNLTSQQFLDISLSATGQQMQDVVITGTQREVIRSESPIPVEIYTNNYFKKNPSPSVFESLNMVNGVQPQLNCNVCNTGDIHINGMEGPYTMVLIDGMPIVSSLSTVYGLIGIPNSIIKRVEIVKGPASTLYGAEALGGTINIITHDYQNVPKVYTDIYTTSRGEFSADVAARIPGKKIRAFTSLSGYYFNTPYDINHDNFTDITLQRRISWFTKADLPNDKGLKRSLAARVYTESRNGGELQWGPELRGSDSLYGEYVHTDRFELLGRYDIKLRKQVVITQYSYNYHWQNSFYGKTPYNGLQHTAFAQVRINKEIGNHQLNIGTALRYIFYDDNTAGTTFKPSVTVLPGVYIEDEWKQNAKNVFLAGLRYDYHNIHGSVVTPRLAWKRKINEQHQLRVSLGNGFRVVNLFTEDHAALTGSRNVIINEDLKPERSWNATINYTWRVNRKKWFAISEGSVFYTYFTNQIVGDFLTDPNLIIYGNLDGHAVSSGVSLNCEWNHTKGLKVNLGGTFLNVYRKTKDSTGVMREYPQLFAPVFSGTLAVSYRIARLGVVIDLTGKVNGPMHLPVVPNDYRPAASPWYGLFNIQLRKNLTEKLEVYGGVKNLLNFFPKNDPILRPFDPFDKNVNDPVNNPYGYTFDTSYNYAPLEPMKVYLGLRLSIK